MNVPANTSLSSTPIFPDLGHETLAQRKTGDRAMTWGLLTGLALLSLGLRLYCLDCYGFWGDEVASLEGARLGLESIFSGRFGWIANQTPLHYIIVWLSMQAADPAVTSIWVRLPSALAGAMATVATYGVGKEMFGRTTGVWAALMLALSAIHINYSQDLRPYSLLLFLTVLSVYCLVKAEKSHQRKWWLAFALAMSANLMNSYFALTLVMPALSLYLLWLLWMRIKSRAIDLGYMLISFFVLGIACLVALSDVARVTRSAPDLSKVRPATIIGSIVELFGFFMQIGVEAQLERVIAVLLLLLACLGMYALAKRSKCGQVEGRHIVLCLLLALVPPIMLALLSTNYVVFQRYALFAMPFYLLLISSGFVLVLKLAQRKPVALLVRIVASVVATLIILPFFVGAYIYNTPAGHAKLAYRPDFRATASYLMEHTQRGDLIIYLDYPALGYTITDFYLQDTPPPAAMFDARDPRLSRQAVTGDIYWIISAENRQMLSKVAETAPTQVVGLDGVIVVQEGSSANVVGSLARMVALVERAGFPTQPLQTLKGSVAQGRGQVSEAVRLYESAGTYFPTGDEYLRTASGYEALGDDKRAWREALLSKFWQPQLPETHDWLARKLQEDDYEVESKLEQQIATMLGQGR